MRAVTIIVGVFLGALLSAVGLFFLVRTVLFAQHVATYQTKAEFWGDMPALFIGGPIGALLGGVVGGFLVNRWRRS